MEINLTGYIITGKVIEVPFREHPVFTTQRNKRKRARLVKHLKRNGITTLKMPSFAWKTAEREE